MSTDQNDARLLYSIPGVKAYHIQNGEEQSLNPTGPQTLSLLMVPTTGHGSIPTTTLPANATQDQDFHLHLSLPPELDLTMPASAQIFHQPPTSYLIPRWDLSPEDGAFTRIEFPRVGKGAGYVSQEDVDTFETILAQCTAFLERAAAPKPSKHAEAYNPADYAKGGKHFNGAAHGQVVLIDEENGSVVGELADGAQIVEDPKLQAGSKTPVEVQVSADGKRIDVRPVSEEYLELSRMPQYQKSTLVQNAAAASRLIVTGSSYLGNMMSSGANNFVTKTKPNAKPMEFKPATHDRVRKINSFTHSAVDLSSKTVGQVSKYAQNLGAGLTKRDEKKAAKLEKDGTPAQSKPGLLNKSMIAFTTIADGIAYSGKTLLTQSGAAASSVVGHKYGAEAGSIASDLAGGVRNVGLVYIDVTGVTRRAVVKSVAKGMVVGRMKDGKQVIVGGGDGGEFSETDLKAAEAAQQQSQAGGYQVPQQPQAGGYQSGAGSGPSAQYGAQSGTSQYPTQQQGTVSAGVYNPQQGPAHQEGGAPPPAYTQHYQGQGSSGGPPQEKGQYRY